MNQYELSDEEDMQLRLSVMLPNRRSLYEYLCELPLEDLKAYPQKRIPLVDGAGCTVTESPYVA